MGKKIEVPTEYVIKSKVKEAISKMKRNTAADVWDALNGVVLNYIYQAVRRAKDNGRKTVRGHDFTTMPGVPDIPKNIKLPTEYVIKSHVKEAISKMGFHTASDVWVGLNLAVLIEIYQGARQAEHNKRKTVRGHDILALT